MPMRRPDNSPTSTSGRNVQRSQGGKLRQETKQPRPSERLRHEDVAVPDLGNNASVPDGEPVINSGEPVPKNKKALREAKKLSKSKLRMEKTGSRLDAAREKLAAQKPTPKAGVIKNIGRAVKAEAWVFTHGKIYQVENENVGIKAAHRTELAGEGIVRGAVHIVKSRNRTRPARRVHKWEQKDIKANADYSFRKTVQENPEMKSGAASRFMQKQKIKRQYQKQAREAAVKTGEKTLSAAEKIGGAVLSYAKQHPAGALILLLCFMLIMVLQSCAGSALTIGNGFMGALGGISYMAEDREINAAELAYTQWEADLTLEALNVESTYPGFHEYRYSIDPTGHDPHALLAFLTAKYNDFTLAEIEHILRDIFNEQYTLTFNELVERRSRTSTWTDENNELQSETVYYDYYILEVILTAKPFAEVIGPMLTAGSEQDRYDIYNISRGNRQYVGSPFPINWLPYVSCGFGYRVHPITGVLDFHRGIDIALPQGTDIFAGGDGVVTLTDNHSLYGLTVVIDYGGGVHARYSHCSELLVNTGQTVQAGDAIARIGSTGESTGPHLDLEVIKDGELLNPLYFVVIPMT